MKTFKMKTPPKKPERGQHTFCADFQDGDTISQIVTRLVNAVSYQIRSRAVIGYGNINESWLIKNLSEISMRSLPDNDYYSCSCAKQACVMVPESMEMFGARVKDYAAKLETYNNWCKSHAVEIENFKLAQKALATARARKEKERIARKVATEKQMLQKVLEQTQQRLNKIKAEEQV